MSARTVRFSLIVLLVTAGAVITGHDGGRRHPRSNLTPPDGAPFPEARGDVKLGDEAFLVRVLGLPAGDYPVALDDGTGTLAVIGTITVVVEDDGGDGDDDDGDGEGGRDDDDDDGDGSHGLLVLTGGDLPFGAAAPGDLAGRNIEVRDGSGAVVLAGKTPSPIAEDPEEEVGVCPLARPDPAVDPDAEGSLRLESGGGRVVIKLHARNLGPGLVYGIVFSTPDASASETIGSFTAGDNGKGRFKLDTDKGDAIPFGAADLEALVGYGVAVKDPDGNTVLTGTVCPPRPRDDNGDDDDDDGDGRDDDDDDGHDDDDDGDDDDEDEACEADLARPDPAPDADATGEVELETDEIEVELKGLEAGATYDVALIDTAGGGASAVIGQVTIGERGRGKLELDTGDGDTLPFGKTMVSELAGFGIEVRTADGVVVLTGTLPGVVCEDDEEEEEGRDDDDDDSGVPPPVDPALGDGAGAVLPADDGSTDPMFVIVGPFDAQFLRGDANGDTALDIADGVSILGYLFSGGARPYCLDAADTDDDGSVDISDPIFLLGHLFLGGRRMPAPGSMILGSDPTADALYCEEQPGF